ncbi:MAG: hypothetical protein PVSMB1_04940 [Gemmatimonadaceae bacterium]
MTRGGVRKGAGRPKKQGEKITVPLGVRVTPSELATIKKAAAYVDKHLSWYVRTSLSLESARIISDCEGMTKRKGKKS